MSFWALLQTTAATKLTLQLYQICFPLCFIPFFITNAYVTICGVHIMALVRGLVTLLLAETALLMLIILTWNTTELLGNTNPNQSKQYARKIGLLRSLNLPNNKGWRSHKPSCINTLVSLLINLFKPFNGTLYVLCITYNVNELYIFILYVCIG